MKEAHKHRLIGATILAAVAVLFLPSFFKDNQHFSVDQSSQIPARPTITAVDFRDPIKPDDIELAKAPESMFVEGAEVSSPLELPSAEVLSQEDVATLLEANASVAEPISSTSASSSSMAAIVAPPVNEKGLTTGYVVRIASLSSKESAAKLEARLVGMRFKAYTRSAPISGGYTYRIFAGPFLSQNDAVSAKQALDKALSVSSIVQKFEP